MHSTTHGGGRPRPAYSSAAPALVAALVALIGAGGCLDWNAARLERDGRTDQTVDADGGRDLPKDMPGDAADAADAPRDTTHDMPVDTDGDTTRDLPDATVDVDGPRETSAEATVEAGSDATDGPVSDVTADGPPIDGALGSLRANGSSCSVNAQCYSGWCADGHCCNQPCQGQCFTCAAAGSQGQCQPVTDGAAPPAGKTACPVGGTCSQDGKCDGAGHCRLAPGGTVCQAAICNGQTQIAVGRVCNGTGSCVQPNGTGINCGKYRCNSSTHCNTPCTNPGSCSSGGCSAGQCGGELFPLGGTCSQDGDCVSNHCVDSVCCESACSGTCESCTVPGQRGHCVNTPQGMAARNGGCAVNGCVHDGKCDGLGGCRTTPQGTSCGLTSCSSGQLHVKTCDGQGQCQDVTISCGPFKCQGGPSCYGRCDSSSQCTTGHTCNSTTRTCQ